MNPNIRIITKDDYDELEKLYSDGKTYKELAKHYNCSTKTISDYLNVKTDIGKKVRIKSNRGWGRKTIYTLIKKDKLLGIGTKREIAKQHNIKYDSVVFYGSPTYTKRATKNGIQLTCIQNQLQIAENVIEKEIQKIIRDNYYRLGETIGFYDDEYKEYCICDNKEGDCIIEFYESKVDMLKDGYLLDI